MGSLTALLSVLCGLQLLTANVVPLHKGKVHFQIPELHSLPCLNARKSCFPLLLLMFCSAAKTGNIFIINMHCRVARCWKIILKKQGLEEAGNIPLSRLRKYSPGCPHWCFNQL